MTASPIRVALAGLSASPYAWANTAHLPVLLNHPSYRLTAIISSSQSSGEAALAAHSDSLPSNIKIYTSSADAAADPDIDLVVVSVNVALHYELTKPALEAGKNVFVEWPLGKDLAEAQELNALRKENGAKGIVGLQERHSPTFNNIKDVVDSGRIGKVLSTTLSATMGAFGPGPLLDRYKYVVAEGSGGSVLSIPVMHVMQGVFHVIDKPDPARPLSALTATKIPASDLLDTAGNVVEEGWKRTGVDHAFLQGYIGDDVLLSLQYRVGSAIDAGIRWYIYGSEGEIEIVNNPTQMYPFSPEDCTIRVKLHSEDKAEVVEMKRNPNVPEGIKGAALDVWGLYDEYAKDGKYFDFDEAVERHVLLDDLETRANQA